MGDREIGQNSLHLGKSVRKCLVRGMQPSHISDGRQEIDKTILFSRFVVAGNVGLQHGATATRA